MHSCQYNCDDSHRVADLHLLWPKQVEITKKKPKPTLRFNCFISFKKLVGKLDLGTSPAAIRVERSASVSGVIDCHTAVGF